MRAAARATLDAGSARVWRVWFGAPRAAAGETEVWSTEEGLSDFGACRTRTAQTAGTALVRLANATEERWPWLGDDSDTDDSPRYRVYAGTASFFGAGSRWSQITVGDVGARRRMHTDPAWILDALSQVQVRGVRRGQTDAVRGQPCERYGFEVDLKRAHDALQLPPYRGTRPPRLIGDAWIDAQGRLRRATWVRVNARRPRSPLKPPATSTWQTVEFWDLGVAPAIEVPTVAPSRRSWWLLDLLTLWWRFRRLSR